MATHQETSSNQLKIKKWTVKRTAFYYNQEMLRHQEIREENSKSVRKSAPAHLENPDRIVKAFDGKTLISGFGKG